MTTADQYRKRAKALTKRMRKPSEIQKTTPIGKKHRALLDMADNEDWLNGVRAKAKL